MSAVDVIGKRTYLAEIVAATFGLYGVLSCWIGLSLKSQLMICVGVGLFFIEIITVFFNYQNQANSFPEKLELIGIRLGFSIIQFLVGIIVYILFNWAEFMILIRSFHENTPALSLISLHPAENIPVRYGLYSILLLKTAFLSINEIGVAATALDDFFDKTKPDV